MYRVPGSLSQLSGFILLFCFTVAVTGLPHPRKDHAIVMTRFARECLHKFNTLAKKLETTLGTWIRARPSCRIPLPPSQQIRHTVRLTIALFGLLL